MKFIEKRITYNANKDQYGFIARFKDANSYNVTVEGKVSGRHQDAKREAEKVINKFTDEKR